MNQKTRNILIVAPIVGLAMTCLSTTAFAQDRPDGRYPMMAASYGIEVEVHGAFGAENVYGATGLGAGVRLSIPLVAGMLGRTVSDNLAISFGGDILHYDNCYYADLCGADYLMFPVAAQWNLFFGRRVSIFGEAGAFVYKGFFDGCAAGDIGCGAPPDLGVLPTLAVGARVHFRHVALVARLGYPTVTLGVSFL
jgi:hypothetical protein